MADAHHQVVNYQGQDNGITSDAQKGNETVECFPTLRGAGKQLALRRFQTTTAADCSLPFQSGDDHKLARFLHLAHVARVRIDEFFQYGLLGGRNDM